MKLKKLKIDLYQKIYTLALRRWRAELGDSDLHRSTIGVSNHALMRYAERFDGYDFEKAEEVVLTPSVAAKIDELGGFGKFSMNGIFYIVKEGNIVTVAKAEGIKANLTYQPIDGSSGRRWSF